MININAEKGNSVCIVDGSVFKSKMCDVPNSLLAKAWNLVSFIWLILVNCSVDVQSCSKV